MTTELPRSWIWATPAQLASSERHALAIGPFGSNLKVSDYRSSGVPLVFVRNIRTSVFDGPQSQFVSEEKARALAAHRVEPGDILVTKMGDPPGDACIYPVGRPPAIITADCIKFRVNENAGNVKYFAYAFGSPAVRSQVVGRTKGVAQQKISLETFRTLRLPVAPVAEQDLIVAEIEKQFTRLDAGVEALRRLQADLRRYRAAVLFEACGGRLAAEPLPAGWTWRAGSDLFSFVTSGSRGWAKYYAESGPLFLRIGNMDRLTIRLDLSDVQHVSPPPAREGVRTLVTPGDVLVSITADLGMVAVVPEGLGEAYVNQHLALARPVEGVHPKYVGWFLASPQGQRQLHALRRGATKVGLGLDDVRAVRVALPPLARQHEIVSEIDSKFSECDAVETALASSIARASRLRVAILAAAFAGRLVSAGAPAHAPAA